MLFVINVIFIFKQLSIQSLQILDIFFIFLLILFNMLLKNCFQYVELVCFGQSLTLETKIKYFINHDLMFM